MPPRVVDGAGDHHKIPAMESSSDSYTHLLTDQQDNEEHQQQLALMEQAQHQALRTPAHAQQQQQQQQQRTTSTTSESDHRLHQQLPQQQQPYPAPSPSFVTPPSHEIPPVASLPNHSSSNNNNNNNNNNNGTSSTAASATTAAAMFFNAAQQQQSYKPPPLPPPPLPFHSTHTQQSLAQHVGLTPPPSVGGRPSNETLRRRSVASVPTHDSLVRQQQMLLLDHSQSSLLVVDDDHTGEASESSFHLGLDAPDSFHNKREYYYTANNNNHNPMRAASSHGHNVRLNGSLSSLGVTRDEIKRQQQEYLQSQQVPNRYFLDKPPPAPASGGEPNIERSSPRNNHSGSSRGSSGAPPPNRYFLSGGKGLQITPEWSSPTRKRRSRNTANSAGRQANSSLFVAPMSAGNGDVLRGIHHQDQLGGSTHDHYSYHRSYSQQQAAAGSNNYNNHTLIGRARTALFSFWTFKMCVMLQIAFVIPLCIFVYDAHHQKRTAHAQLAQFSEEQEHILNQMMWIDKAAKRITESKRNSVRGGAANLDSVYEAVAAGAVIDGADDLRESMSRLRSQMRDMQYRIQQNSKARITEKYGEGPVRVFINPEPSHSKVGAALADKSNNEATRHNTSDNAQEDETNEEDEKLSEIVLDLFVEETPHAVSTWLYQIERGHWNRVQMNYLSQTAILSKPGWVTDTNSLGDFGQTASRLEFLETLPRPAQKNCEVSLVQTGEGGNLALRINLVEGPFHEEDDVCIGRVVNDSLLLPRNREYFMATFATASSHPNKTPPRAETKSTPHQKYEEEDGGGGDIL